MPREHKLHDSISITVQITIIYFHDFFAGVVRERATWCYPVFHIFDSLGTAILKIRGPMFHFGTCGENVPFDVISLENDSQIATITKLWGNFLFKD